MGIVFLEYRFIELINLLKLGSTIPHILKSFTKIGDANELSEILQELKKNQMIIHVCKDDMICLQKKRQKYVLSPGLETLYLIVTDNCNLRCSYCFINNNMPENYRHLDMSIETAKESIDMFFNNISKNPPAYSKLNKTIYFYGGEPLLNFEIIKETVRYIESRYEKEIQKMGKKFRMSIITNGSLINKEIAEFIANQRNLYIAISIDGPEHIHNKQRQCVGGEGSFLKAINGYKLIKSVNPKKEISVSSTISDGNIDCLSELLKLNQEYGFTSINLNPLVDTAQKTISKEYMETVAQKMIDYFILAREDGVYEDRIMRKTKAFIKRKIHAYDCQALGAQLVCSPDGSLGVCHEGIGIRQFFFDKVSSKFNFHNNPTINEWKKRTPLNMPQCFNCPAIGICGGGCAYGAWLRNGSIWSVDDRFCIHSLKTLDWIIWDLFEQINR